jgi:hypothetical protein
MPYGPVFMYDDTQTADFVLYHGPYVKIWRPKEKVSTCTSSNTVNCQANYSSVSAKCERNFSGLCRSPQHALL